MSATAEAIRGVPLVALARTTAALLWPRRSEAVWQLQFLRNSFLIKFYFLRPVTSQGGCNKFACGGTQHRSSPAAAFAVPENLWQAARLLSSSCQPHLHVTSLDGLVNQIPCNRTIPCEKAKS